MMFKNEREDLCGDVFGGGCQVDCLQRLKRSTKHWQAVARL